MSQRWMPLLGEFDTTSEPWVFKGEVVPVPAPSPSSGEAQTSPAPELASVGILLSNLKMVNGRLRVTAKFSTVTLNSVCELIFGYDHITKKQVNVGIGGGGAMFSIREWVPATTPQSQGRWTNHQLLGDRSNLLPGVPYELGVRVQGSAVSLEVDGVEVGAATLPSMLNQARQVGLFLLSTSQVEISGFAAEIERPKAFIVMQFSSPYNEVYSDVIKDVCEREEFNIDAGRADEIYGPGIIIKDVIDRIARSQFVIADISPDNPNVYFEVGYALALGKPIILLAQHRKSGEPLPFDLSAFRVLFYDDTIGGKQKLEKGLVNHLREILGRSNPSDYSERLK